MHINIRKIKKHFKEFQIQFNEISKFIDVVAMTEVNEKEELMNYVLQGYECFYKLRENRRGGGVCLYIRTNLYFEENKMKMDCYENIQGQIKMGNINGYILLIYRPPNTSKSSATFHDQYLPF